MKPLGRRSGSGREAAGYPEQVIQLGAAVKRPGIQNGSYSWERP